ncbi:hypothetical protein V9T40_002792 [Parthenolecanium corni]|uniref:Pentatricopeptide repeat-containing protein n=1 Tax=Parthenolecanium corni TaxID=536013 RepID=A0AAN9TL22_9HEMI
MHRKVIQTILSTAFRPGVNVYTTPRLHFHLMKHVLFSKSPSLTPATEEITDFSDLSSEEFGTLHPNRRNTRQKMEQLPEEEDERIEFDLTNEEGRKNRRPKEYYEKLIEKFLAEKRMVEALDVLETRILKQDRIAPWYRVYNLLINGCAKAGYYDKAFHLYKSMKDRFVKTTPATYTGLFNAIANSPFPKNAERRLTSLRKKLADDSIELTAINYHAMIKAYARLKDTYSAFLVADEMLSKGHALTTETYSFLLQACISDSEAGLRHALLLWHKMRSSKITPDEYTYNLFLRCIRDCGFGTEKDLQDVLRQITVGRSGEGLLGSGEPNSWSKRISWKRKSKKTNELSSDGQSETDCEETKTKTADILEIKCESTDAEITDDIGENESEENQVAKIDTTDMHKLTQPELMENKPNLLAIKPHLGNIVAVKDVKTASDRLLLLGGFNAIFEQMKSDGVPPSIKTFTILLDVMPGTDVAEERLLKEMKSNNLHIDIDFYNMLIKKRAMRHDYEKAREVLDLIQSDYLQPDIVTFGVLALSCNNRYQAEELCYQLQDFGYRLNLPILGAMLAKACSKFDFDYVLFIMKKTLRIGLKVDEEYLKNLENLDSKVMHILKRKKHGDKTLRQIFYEPHFLENYKMWKKYYERFHREIDVVIPQHPYEQFQKIKENTKVTENAENDSEKVETDSKFTRRTNYRQRNNDRTRMNSESRQFRSVEDNWEDTENAENESEKVENNSKFTRRTNYRQRNNDRTRMNSESRQFRSVEDDWEDTENAENESEKVENNSKFTRRTNYRQRNDDRTRMNSESRRFRSVEDDWEDTENAENESEKVENNSKFTRRIQFRRKNNDQMQRNSESRQFRKIGRDDEVAEKAEYQPENIEDNSKSNRRIHFRRKNNDQI